MFVFVFFFGGLGGGRVVSALRRRKGRVRDKRKVGERERGEERGEKIWLTELAPVPKAAEARLLVILADVGREIRHGNGAHVGRVGLGGAEGAGRLEGGVVRRGGDVRAAVAGVFGRGGEVGLLRLGVGAGGSAGGGG